MRVYGRWAGNPRGVKEDPTRCIVEVAVSGRSVLFHQCLKKRGHGMNGAFCGQHAKMYPDGAGVYVPKDE